MSVECWGPFAALSIRLILCGHIFKPLTPINCGLDVRCQVCQMRHPVPGVLGKCNFAPLSRSPSKQLKWDGLKRRNTRKCRPKTCARAPVANLEELLAELAAGASRVDLHSSRLAPMHAPRDESSFLVFRASPCGSIVSGGNIELPEQGVLLLDGAGAHFQGTTFSGAAVVCAGPAYSGSFRGCTFSDCQLYAVHGAAATLRSCTFRRANPALTASGPGTTATLTSCTFTECPGAVIVNGGATAAVAMCSVERAISGAAVSGAGSHVTLTATHLRGGHRYSSGSGVGGVRVYHSSAALRRCSIGGFYIACATTGLHSDLEVRDTEIQDCTEAADAQYGARMLLRDTSMSHPAGAVEDAAVFVGHDTIRCAAGTMLQMDRCRLDWGVGVGAGDDSRVAITRSTLTGRSTAVNAGGNACMVALTDCEASSDDVCVRAHGSGATLRAARCALLGELKACVAADRAAMALVDTRLSGAPRYVLAAGLAYAADGAMLRLLRCTLRGGSEGVRVRRGRVVAVDVTVAQLADADDNPEERPLLCDELVSDKVRTGAAYLCRGGHCEVRGGSVENCTVGAVVSDDFGDEESTEVATGATAVFRGVLFAHCSEALRVESKGPGQHGIDVEVAACHAQDVCDGLRAMCHADVALRVSDTVFVGQGPAEEGQAVSITGASGDVSFDSCQFSRFPHGVTLQGACMMRMRDVDIADGEYGVHLGPPGTGSLPCWACDRHGIVAERAAWNAARGACGAVAGALCAHDGAIARMTMERVTVDDMNGPGIGVCEAGHLTAADVHVRRCEPGLDIAYMHEPSVFTRCKVTARRGVPATDVWRRETFSDSGILEEEERDAEDDDEVEGVEVVRLGPEESPQPEPASAIAAREAAEATKVAAEIVLAAREEADRAGRPFNAAEVREKVRKAMPRWVGF